MMELNEKERAQANCVAENAIRALCIGGAKILKGTGTVIKLTTDTTAGVLRGTANLVEKGGNVSSGYCFSKADKLNAKANKSNARIEELMAVIEKAQAIIDAEKKTETVETVEAEVVQAV